MPKTLLMPCFTIEEIEKAFDRWYALGGITDKDVLAEAWHGIAVQLAIIGATKINA
jgi:hypothetical protein